MEVTINGQAPGRVKTACLVIGVFEDSPPEGPALEIDQASGNALSRLLASGDIETARNFTTLLHGLPGVAAERILVLGCGLRERFDRARYQAVCLAAGRFLRDHPVREAHICLNQLPVEELPENWRLQQAIVAFDRANYFYFATKPIKDDSPKPLHRASFQAGENLAPVLPIAKALCSGVRTTRELSNLPPNICTPIYLAEFATSLAAQHARCSAEVLDREAMQKLGMGALLGVAQGSSNPPRLVVLHYQGAKPDTRPHVLIGKGVTFDTGGISIKPREGMEQMKFDMCGAASVIGAFQACATLGLNINLIAIVAAVENMPDGNAYRPGDVLSSMAGKTIEIVNTDAEGRLALCDALEYCRRFDPESVVDVATLTGACVVALGHHASALMTRDEQLADELLTAGQQAVDRAWRLPLWEEFNQQIKSQFADLKNSGGSPGGAITAGCFLAKFTQGLRWAHLDIAGTAWKNDQGDGATGRPVGLLFHYLLDRAA